ncbi:uncharacterized protein LOC125504230 [Dendroctonus ponderosae]|uniref:uncharacterized protein LOC125504230 n=1 Tax=Dendroctonus ponderosae TaxID=77166 RepID=UPI002034AD08|nr:uncharacterized protein LOC125504230 [Dendroctonus ponderosae]
MYFVYVHFHMEVKLMMLTYYVTTIDTMNSAEIATQSTNHEYYRNMMTKLAIIVEKHSVIKRYNNAFAKQLQLLYMLYICSGVIFGLSAVCTLVSRPFKLIKSLSTWIAYVVFSMSLTHVSQCFEDASANLSDAVLNLKWYNWNKPCQLSYLILITNCLKGMPVSVLLLFDANYSFYKKVTRFLYTMGGFLYSIRK